MSSVMLRLPRTALDSAPNATVAPRVQLVISAVVTLKPAAFDVWNRDMTRDYSPTTFNPINSSYSAILRCNYFIILFPGPSKMI